MKKKLRIIYMLGDCGGTVFTTVDISPDNIFVQPLLIALSKLKHPPSRWGTILYNETFEYNKKVGNITDKEHDLLDIITNKLDEEDDVTSFLLEYGFADPQDGREYLDMRLYEYLYEFDTLLTEDTAYVGLTYQGYEIITQNGYEWIIESTEI